MCGIFGVIISEHVNLKSSTLKSIVDILFILSASRGKEASGIGVFTDGRINVYKEDLIGSKFIHSRKYRQLFEEIFCDTIKKPLAIIGHTRLATNGLQTDNNNNCPLIYGDVIGMHNGIVVNNEELWKAFPLLERTSEVDSESLFALLNFFIKSNLSLIESTKNVFNKIEGSASIACLVPKSNGIILATNTGSLYSCRNAKNDIYIFASESYILEKLIKRLKLKSVLGQYDVLQIKPGHGRLINIQNLAEQEFSLI